MYDNVFLFRFVNRIAVYLFALVVTLLLSGAARADVATPPPSAPTQPTTTQTTITKTANGFPSTVNLTQKYGFDQNNPNKPLTVPAKKQFGSVQNGVATKTNPVRITDPYGNVARTTVQTQTQLPNSKLNQLVGGYVVGNIAGNIVNSENAKQAARDLAHRNFGSAAVNAAAAFDVFDVGSGLYGLFDEYENARAAIAQPMHDAAKAKAEQAAAQAAAAAQANGSDNAIPDMSQFAANETTGKPQKYPKLLFLNGYINDVIVVPDWFYMDGGFTGEGFLYEVGENRFVIGNPNSEYDPESHLKVTNVKTVDVHEGNYHQYKDVIDNLVRQATPTPTIEDFLLNDAEIQAVIANTLGQILSGQQQNTAVLTDLVNMLWSGNQLNASNTQTTVAGTPAQNTFLSEPYTPAGSNQAQQTQHTINKDGSVTTIYIPRSDLKPNSNQAPTKGILKPKKDKDDIDVDIDEDSDDDKKDKDESEEICNEENQDRLLCVRAGSDVYKDLEIPSETVEIDFKKDTYFAEHGSCPAPVKFSFLGEHEISYEPLCDLARGLRPIVELLGVLTAMGIAYGAVREL